MEATMEMTKDPNMLVAKKSTKEKLKEWYVNNFNKTKENDFVRKVLKTAGDIYSTAMSAAFSIFAPEFSALAPLAKVQADVGLKAYDGLKSAVDQAAGIELKEDNTESASYLSDEETKALAETSTAALGKINAKISENSKKKAEEIKKAKEAASEASAVEVSGESKGRSR